MTRFIAAAPLCLALAACGDDGGTGGGGGSDDRFHPATNGNAISEADACESLKDALGDTAQSLMPSCVFTAPVCPQYIRSESGTDCLQYDEGTIDGCAGYFRDATDCDDLNFRRNNCVVVPIAGSEPNGCP